MSRNGTFLACCCLVLAGTFGSVATASGAEEYRIGPGDVLNISVWERPDLTRSVAVRQSGSITFPPLGDVVAVGQTGAELARTLEQRLNEFLRTSAQVTVEVSAVNSQYVTVSGAVGTPGRYSFEHLPGIVDILGSTGGLGANGDLSSVQVLRTEANKPVSIKVDIAAALKNGTFADLPPLQSGDMIFVPSFAGDVGSGTNVAYVAGQISRPGAYPVGGGLDLMKVITLAGGLVPGADASNVQIMGHEGTGTFIASIDLRRYLDSGVSGFMVRPGDSIILKTSSSHRAWAITERALSMTQNLFTVLLIRDYLRTH